jgi:hypothetical protein
MTVNFGGHLDASPTNFEPRITVPCRMISDPSRQSRCNCKPGNTARTRASSNNELGRLDHAKPRVRSTASDHNRTSVQSYHNFKCLAPTPDPQLEKGAFLAQSPVPGLRGISSADEQSVCLPHGFPARHIRGRRDAGAGRGGETGNTVPTFSTSCAPRGTA